MRGTRILAIEVAVMLLMAAPARTASFTWTGTAPLTGPSGTVWSNAQNWAGGTAPSGSVGTLSFPRLPSSGCASMFSSSYACYTAQNDLSGLSANAITIDSSSGYLLMGNPLTLGAGGLTAAPRAGCPCGVPLIALPLTLGVSQAWSVDSNPLNVAGNLSGPGAALRITTSNQTQLVLGGDDEVGPVTLAGANTHQPSLNGNVILQGTPPPMLVGPGGGPPSPAPIGSTPAYLNAHDGNPVTVDNTTLDFAAAAVGPLTGTDAEIAGAGSPVLGSLTVDGSLAVDHHSAMAFFFNGGRYTRITATGPVSLGGPIVFLDVASSSAFGANLPCQRFPAGAVYTPISSTGALTGTFAFIANGDQIVIGCARGVAPTVRVRYTTHAFQLTVLPAHGGVLLPQRQAPVSPGGGGAIFIACRGPAPCSGKVLLPRGMAQFPVSYEIGNGGTFAESFTLTGGGERQLRRHHGRLRIAVTVLPRRGRAFRVPQTLTPG